LQRSLQNGRHGLSLDQGAAVPQVGQGIAGADIQLQQVRTNGTSAVDWAGRLPAPVHCMKRMLQR
jgi:hypothetical protein